MSSIPTVAVVNPHAAGEFYIINESDFDPARHVLFGAQTPASAATTGEEFASPVTEAKGAEIITPLSTEHTHTGASAPKTSRKRKPRGEVNADGA